MSFFSAQTTKNVEPSKTIDGVCVNCISSVELLVASVVNTIGCGSRSRPEKSNRLASSRPGPALSAAWCHTTRKTRVPAATAGQPV